ncbi:hypothetical protein NDU88_003960 [Pleurodeles waltl]|uniref:Uncharacterized protein n=1 Tax=Pleurodeles waltl TaxID=8319 RepID=A0AAV7LIH8_PLEWA|nr:hypothetical protein NDU88_003960 [Pleurodeles waltl]
MAGMSSRFRAPRNAAAGHGAGTASWCLLGAEVLPLRHTQEPAQQDKSLHFTGPRNAAAGHGAGAAS